MQYNYIIKPLAVRKVRYYAYSIDGNTITIHDACHSQNMK